jgi:hypothetical protein
VEDHDLGEASRLAAATGAHVCFEDEAGQNLRPPKARTWAPRGHTPVVRVSGKGSGKVSVAGVACYKPGTRARFFYRARTHYGCKGERRSMSEAGYARLVTAAHHQLHAPMILVWDYVARHIIPVVCPAVLCGQRRLAAGVAGGDRLDAAAAGHIMLGLSEAASSTPWEQRGVVPMLESYFVKPQTVDRIRACWIGAEIERYAGWLSEQGYSARTVLRRVPVLVAFGEFARMRGASAPADLPAHVDGFVAMRVASFRRGQEAAGEIRGAVEQILAVVLPGFERTGRPHRDLPFARTVPRFFEYLAAERGLRPESIVGYRHHRADRRDHRRQPWHRCGYRHRIR